MSDTKEINQMKMNEIKDTDRYEFLIDCSGLNEIEKKKFISNVIFYYLSILKIFSSMILIFFPNFFNFLR